MDLLCLLVLVEVDVPCSTSHGSGTDAHVGVFTLLRCTDMTHRPQLEKKSSNFFFPVICHEISCLLDFCLLAHELL